MQLKKLQRHSKAKLGKPASSNRFLNSDASDLCEKQMLSRTYLLKEEVQVPGLGCRGPTDGDAGCKCRQKFLSDTLIRLLLLF